MTSLTSLTEDLVLGRSSAAGEPDWLRDRRLSAYKTYVDQRWPDRKLDEYWRNTAFGRLVDVELPLATAGDDAALDLPVSLVEFIDGPIASVTIVDGDVVDLK